MVDIFGYLKELNLGIQGTNTNFFRHINKILMKIIATVNIYIAPLQENYSEALELSKEECLTFHQYRTLPPNILDLRVLHEKVMRYFPNEIGEIEHIVWVRNRFEVDCSEQFLSFENGSKTNELSFDRFLIRIKV